MPSIRIRALPQKNGVDLTAVMKRLCVEVATVVDVPAARVFATWETVGAGHFVQGDQSVDRQPAASHPPMVQITAFEGRTPEMIERVLECVSRVLCTDLGLEPGNAFIHYLEARSGQLYTGGRVMKKG